MYFAILLLYIKLSLATLSNYDYPDYSACDCISEEECIQSERTILNNKNECIENLVCCENSFTYGNILIENIFKSELLPEDYCRCILQEDCKIIPDPSNCNKNLVCCNITDIKEPQVGSITSVEPSALKESCTCKEKEQCSEPVTLSSIVHVRTRSSHKCTGTQVCCLDNNLTLPSITDIVACTCMPERQCLMDGISTSKIGHFCSGNEICCPNYAIYFLSMDECTCVHESFCEDDPSLHHNPEAGEKHCLDPQICCRKPKIFAAPPKCGLSFQSNFRIDVRTGTSIIDSKFGEFPWMVAIMEWKSDGTESFLCGGSLINPKVILTSASCIDERSATILKIRAGEWDLESTSEERPYVERLVAARKMHPSWSSKTLNNNVALLYLSKKITLQDHINTICLPIDRTVKFDAASCTLSGWGKSKFDEVSYHTLLKKLKIPIVFDICQQKLQNTKLGKQFVLDKSNICAGDGIIDSCTGDGGSPLICPMSDGSKRFMQVGIASWGLECGGNIPSVYASIFEAIDWIKSTVTKDMGKSAASYYT